MLQGEEGGCIREAPPPLLMVAMKLNREGAVQPLFHVGGDIRKREEVIVVEVDEVGAVTDQFS